MKKQSITTFSALAGLLMFLFVSCGNLLNPPNEPPPGANQGRALLSVGNGVEGARTIFPSGINFSTYKLTFNGPEGSTEAPPKVFDPGDGTQFVDLDAGEWTITAEAYIGAYEEGVSTPVASGFVTVTVNHDVVADVTIPIHGIGGTGTGTVTYRITDVETLGVTGTYSLTPYGSGSPLSGSLAIDSEETLSDVPSGEYLLKLQLNDAATGKQKAVTEVVYVYQGLTTAYELFVVAADFGNVTRISGAVRYTEDGDDQSGFQVIAATDPGYTGNDSGIGSANEYKGSYSLSIPRPVADITVYFFVKNSGSDLVRPAGRTTIRANASSEVYAVSCEITTVNISGTLEAKNFSASSTPSATATLKAYADIERQNLAGFSTISDFANGTKLWSIDVARYATPTPVYFTLEVNDSDGAQVIRHIPDPVMVSTNTIHNHDLGTVDKNARAIYGKVAVVVNGSPATNATLRAYADQELTRAIGDSVDVTNGAWSIPLTDASASYNSVCFKIEGQRSGTILSRVVEAGMYANSQNSDFLVDLGTVKLVTQVALQGALTFRINGSSVEGDTIYVVVLDPEEPDSPLGYAACATDGSGRGSWNLSIDRPDSATTYALKYYSSALNRYIFDGTITVNSAGATITRPNDSVNLTLPSLSGTARKGNAPVGSGVLYVVLDNQSQSQSPVGIGSISEGAISGYVLSGASSGYVVVVDKSGDMYITKNPVSLSESLSLELNDMTKISTGGSDGPGTIEPDAETPDNPGNPELPANPGQ
jgi:hypothetical protein